MEIKKFLSNEEKKEFTMDFKIPFEIHYLEDWRSNIQEDISKNFNELKFNEYLKRAKNRELNYYGETDRWLYEAFEKFPIENKDVCIFGSANPWYEAISVEFGAKSCTVLEFSDRPSFHPSIRYLKPDFSEGLVFDVGISVSSFEHYGLGRYGDPLDPEGDFRAMGQAKKVIRKFGKLYLSVPVGKDCIYYNAHRIYGRCRFQKLIDNWKLLDSYGFNKDSFDSTINGKNTPYQPVFVLESD